MTPTQKRDLIDSKEYYIYNAAQKFNPEKSKFPTYLGHTAKYLCLSQTSENVKHSSVNFDDVEFMETDANDTPDDACAKHEIIESVLEIIEKHSDERVKTIFKERYFNPHNNKLKSWREIAPLVNLSIQGCINLHDKTIDNLQKRYAT